MLPLADWKPDVVIPSVPLPDSTQHLLEDGEEVAAEAPIGKVKAPRQDFMEEFVGGEGARFEWHQAGLHQAASTHQSL